METTNDEHDRLRRVALQTAQSILLARKQAEEELRSHSEWLKVTLASIGDALISTDAEGRVNFMNETAERLTGWTLYEAIHQPLQSVFRIVNETTRDTVETPVSRVLREGVIVGLANHTILISRDGTERPIDDSAAPVRIEGGAIIGCVLVFRDISERRASERVAERSEREFADFFENANVGLHWAGPDGVIVRVNQAELDMLGYTREEYVGRHIAEFHSERTVIDDILARLATGEKLREYPAVLRCKDGSTRQVLINATVLFENGKFVHTRCFTQDITDRMRAHSAQLTLAAIVETSDDAIVSKTLDGIIRSWNPGAERIFGYSASEAIGRPIDLIIPHELRGDERMIIQRIKRGERVDHFETTRVAKDGRRLDISLTVSPIKNAYGTIVGASKVARDITDRKRSEVERESLLVSERHARAESERAGRIKEEFLATLSHELRTPLNAILGWLHVIANRPRSDEALLNQGLSVIERNARMQAQLIADLLDMSRITSGKMRIELERVELPLVIEAALDSVRSMAEAKGIELRRAMDPSTGAVNGDPSRLQQVVWNLLSNGVKFTPKGGQVTVSVRQEGAEVKIAVTDSGKGISSDFLPHVFERFRQADGATTRQHGGLGLGLSIVKQLVELHGGSVQASSEGDGAGATFTVTLPVASPRPAISSQVPSSFLQDPKAAVPVTMDLTAVRVLFVDDEADARDLVSRLLEERGAKVAVAASADEALASVAHTRPDVILSDIGLPERDGYALLREIRLLGIDAPAAALTAFARPEDTRRIVQAGFYMHVTKPIEPARLIAAVAELASIRPTPE